jgi:hypothetical protein
VEIVLSVIPLIDAFQTKLLRNGRLLKPYSGFCDIVSDIIIGIAIVQAFWAKDETEIFRLKVYSLHTLFMLAVTLAGKFRDGSLTNLIEFTGYNVFVVIAAQMHWPYQYCVDAAYQDTQLQDDAREEDVPVEGISDGGYVEKSESEEVVVS